MNEEAHSCCEHDEAKRKPWYASGLFLILRLTFLLLAASFVFPSLTSFHRTFFDYVRMMFWPIPFIIILARPFWAF